MPIIKKTIISIKFDYIYANEILKLFKNYLEIDSKYETNITLSYEIPVSEKEYFKEKLVSLTKNQIYIDFID